MNTKPLNKNELQRFLRKMNYTEPVADDELRAIRICQLLYLLGCEVTHERIEQELKIVRETNWRKEQEAQAADYADWIMQTEQLRHGG